MTAAHEILAGHGITPGDGTVGGHGEPAALTEGEFRALVANRKAWLRANQAAQAEIDAENAPTAPRSVNGSAFLAEPDDEPRWRLDGLWPADGNVVLAAQFKAGKTTLRDNLIRSLCDGGLFLDRFAAEPLPGQLYVLDVEMPSRVSRRWLNEQLITNSDRFEYLNLRGAAASFNPASALSRAEWASRLADVGAAAVILDCIGPVLAALGLDENSSTDVGRFLAGFEQMLSVAGVRESCVIHHMGHGSERSRGASRLRDWPDAEWRLVRQDDNPASPRYLSAFGRDVDMPESRLEFDPATRHLRVSGGSRRSEKQDAALAAIADLLSDGTPRGCNQIEAELAGEHTQKAVRDALRQAVADKDIAVTPGPNRSKLHSLAAAGALVRQGALPVRQRTSERECVGASVRISDAPLTRTTTTGGAGPSVRQDLPAAQACPDCGAPHVRYGEGGRPCRKQDLIRHGRASRGSA